MDPQRVRFDGAVVLVTGAARGLGLSYARHCAARGARVVVNDLGIGVDGEKSRPQAAAEAAAEICRDGGVAIADAGDISTAEGAAGAVAVALDQFGRLDAVINNAGAVRASPFAEASLEDLDAMLSSHVRGAFLVNQAAWRTMVAQGEGRIVMTTSSAGLYGQAGLSAYGAAKAALIGLTRSLALEGQSVGVKVNAVAPLGHTRLNANLADLERRTLFERHFNADLVAPLVVLLAHPVCPVNGEVFSAGGGRFVRNFIAEGAGYIDPNPSVEAVRDHLATVVSEREYTTPLSATETFSRTVQLIAPS